MPGNSMPPATTTVPLSLSIAPSGHVLLSRLDSFAAAIPHRTAARIEEAFARGSGNGLFHLGAGEFSDELGPVFGYWRDFARGFVANLCGHIDIDQAVAAGLEVSLSADEAARFVLSAPPMQGNEYLCEEVLQRAWNEIALAFRAELSASGLDAQSFLKSKNAVWNMVGRVFFHLAENKGRRDTPFAFLATYTTRLSQGGKLQHKPLGKAIEEQAGARDPKRLLSVLLPIQQAAAESAFLKELVDSGRVFRPQAWNGAEAHRFLKEVPLFESKGIFVRLPDWWKPHAPPRLKVSVVLGQRGAEGLGANALLDFSVAMALDGESISDAEWSEILAGTESLALIRGRWVEVDHEKLKDLLENWRTVQRTMGQDGVSFRDAVRLIAGVPIGGGEGLFEPATAVPARDWLSVEAGAWLRKVLDELRGPQGIEATEPGPFFLAQLRPYQNEGLKWLRFLDELKLGGCLADDMGLGKTVQVLALLAFLKKKPLAGKEKRPSLLVIPASLIGNWKAECGRFTPSLELAVVHPSEATPEEMEKLKKGGLPQADLVVTTYGMLHRQPWLKEVEWGLVVLDEAQAIKNPAALQTKAAKELKSRNRLALTGTPVENRAGDLWSLFDFLNPGLLGGAKEFGRFLASAEKSGASGSRAEVYGSLRKLVGPYILRRLKTDKRIIADLPDKTEVKVFATLTKTQAVLYQRAVEDLAAVLKTSDGIKRRGVILSFLLRFKQICNHPSQWSGDGAYEPAQSGKMLRLREISEEIASRQEKVLVFTQFREMTAPLERFLGGVFGRAGLILDGTTPVKKRRTLVEDFQAEEGPPFLVLSLKAGGIGLNLTAASHVVHFDRWWNPAVENQATDRAYRIGQKKNVLVHKFVCRGTVEESIDAMLESKQDLADQILKTGAEGALTEMGDEELLRFVSLDINTASSDAG